MNECCPNLWFPNFIFSKCNYSGTCVSTYIRASTSLIVEFSSWHVSRGPLLNLYHFKIIDVFNYNFTSMSMVIPINFQSSCFWTDREMQLYFLYLWIYIGCDPLMVITKLLNPKTLSPEPWECNLSHISYYVHPPSPPIYVGYWTHDSLQLLSM